MKRRLVEVVLCFSRRLTEQGGPHGGLVNHSACLQEHEIYIGTPSLAVLRADLLLYENTKAKSPEKKLVFFILAHAKPSFMFFIMYSNWYHVTNDSGIKLWEFWEWKWVLVLVSSPY